MSAWFASALPSKSRMLAACAFAGALVWICGSVGPGPVVQAQSAKPASGKETCATCHLGVVEHYSHAPMRHAMETEDADPILKAHPKLTVQIGPYHYTIESKDGQSTYSVTDGTDTLTLPLHLMFGQHSQTWVLVKDGNYYESLVSYFPREQGLATTPGDSKLTPHTLTEAMGRKLSTWETLQCFNCHASDATEGVHLTLDKLRPGLECERCHVGALQHMADAASDNYKTLPKSLKKMDAESVSNFCGRCHRTWDTVLRNHWHGPAFVRFQPYRLENSKCFIGNDPRISCLACHDPHQAADRNDADYDPKCLACHGVKEAAMEKTPTKTCPVAKANCVSCHMPKIELPGGHAAFTDHYIRIVKAGEPYPY